MTTRSLRGLLVLSAMLEWPPPVCLLASSAASKGGHLREWRQKFHVAALVCYT